MWAKSITFKLLSIIIISFVITAICVLVAADSRLTHIIDKSQDAVYGERIDAIWEFLFRSNNRLGRTGLVEVYKEDFQESALKSLKQIYYIQGRSIYPFILDLGGKIVMHPVLERGSLYLNQTDIPGKMLNSNQGKFEYVLLGKESWYIFKHFTEWDWVIGYTVPLDIKYSDAIKFRNIMIYIMGGISLTVLLVLSLIVTRFTKPIIKLTYVSTQIAAGNLNHPIDLGGKDETGTLARSFSFMRDSISRQILELKLEQNRAANILEGTNAGTWDWNIQTGELRLNERWAQIMGHTLEELEPVDTQTWKNYIHPRDLTKVNVLLEQHFKGVTDYYDAEFRQSHKDGGWVWVAARGKVVERSESGEPVRMSGTHLDITERKQAEEELVRLRSFLSNIIDSMPSVLVGVDKAGKVIQWNRTAEQTTGISADKAHGRPLAQVFPMLAPEIKRIFECIKTCKIKRVEKRPRIFKDTTLFEDVTIYPLTANGVEGAVIRIDDVTEKVFMEETIIQSEKMLSVGGLAAGMAHEINNPLAGIMQTANLMANRLGENYNFPANVEAAKKAGTSMEAIRYYMEIRGIPRMIVNINEAGQRMAAIVDNMLSFARKSDARASSQDLSELLDKTLELAITDYDLKKHYDFKVIEIIKEYEDNLPMVVCEGAKIQQVLLNILRNGAQAMQEAGTKNPRFVVRVYFKKSRGMIYLEIEDSGPGMDEAIRKRIFEPFYTTKPVGVGTGLGLSVSYFIVTENHKGELAVKSRPGKGTTFIMGLPLTSSSKQLFLKN